MFRRLSERNDEQRPGMHLLLPDADKVAPVRTALALVLRGQEALSAYCLHRPGEELSDEFRIARYGLGHQREADRAVRRLVQYAVRGAHVDIKPVPGDEEGLAALKRRLSSAPESSPLVVGWSRQGALPDRVRLLPLLAGYPGPMGLLIDDDGPPFTEVLGLALGDTHHPAVNVTGALLRAVERSHPTFRVAATSASQAERALRDAGPRTLVMIPVGERVPAGLLATPQLLEERITGRLLLVFAAEKGRTARIAEILDALSSRRSSRAAS